MLLYMEEKPVKKALYAGSFDPLTLGHLDIIRRASALFDELTIGVTVNLEKKSLFTFDERVEMIKEVTADLPNIKVDECKGLLAAYVNDNDFDVVVRGLRNTADFVDEESMAQLHRHLYKKAETVFLISDAGYEFISSTMAKQVVGLGGDGSGLVPPQVLDKMKGKMGI